MTKLTPGQIRTRHQATLQRIKQLDQAAAKRLGCSVPAQPARVPAAPSPVPPRTRPARKPAPKVKPDPRATWHQLVHAQMQAGLPHHEATRKAAIENEQARSDFVAASNQQPDAPLSDEQAAETVKRFHQAVASEMAGGKTKSAATRHVCRTQPHLHLKFIKAINQQEQPR